MSSEAFADVIGDLAMRRSIGEPRIVRRLSVAAR
jgi:hypothetical protein